MTLQHFYFLDLTCLLKVSKSFHLGGRPRNCISVAYLDVFAMGLVQQVAAFALLALLLAFVRRQWTAEKVVSACSLELTYCVDLQRFKRYEALAKQHNCLPPPLLENQRPFGIDRLEQIFHANNESRLMELFLFHIRQTGNTLKQCFLGTPAYGTIEPANLEAILSTNFKGL